MAYEKNDVVTVLIEDMGNEGEGIGKIDGYTIFIKDGVMGDVIEAKIMKVKKNYAYGKLLRIIEKSPYRVEPRCTVHRQCGGCQIQALSYEMQLKFKENKVKNHLLRIGKFSYDEIEKSKEEMIGMDEPYYYRNKAQFPVGRDKHGKIITGFFAGRTHTIIPNKNCCLGIKENEQILEIIIKHMERYQIVPYDEYTKKGLVRHILIRYGFSTGELMVCLILNGRKEQFTCLTEMIEDLCTIKGMASICVNRNEENTNVILGKEIQVLWGKGYITDKIHGMTFRISPLSFYQVNPLQTEKLYEKVLEYGDLKGNENVWDLYCGIGTISLFLSKKAGKVYGVEVIPQAIKDAKKNAIINDIHNAEFFVGKAEEFLPEYNKKYGEKADIIVVDPPRKGCQKELLETIVHMKPDRLVYVSCDSSTLARDLRFLCDRGFELKRWVCVDMFGMTVHTECVVWIQKKHI